MFAALLQVFEGESERVIRSFEAVKNFLKNLSKNTCAVLEREYSLGRSSNPDEHTCSTALSC